MTIVQISTTRSTYCGQLSRVFRFPREGDFALGRDKHRDCIPNLRTAVEGTSICETVGKGPGTGLTLVEVTARKLFPD